MTVQKMAECYLSSILNFLGGQQNAIRPYVFNQETLKENSK